MEEVKKRNTKYIHCIIMLIIAFGFQLLPPFGGLTKLGMWIVGGFLAAIYGWITVDMFLPCVVAFLSLGCAIGMDKAIAAGFGNTTVIGMLFIFMVLGVLNEVGAVNWIIDKLLRAKIFLGKPWLMVWLLLFTCFILGNFGAPLMIVISLEFIIAIMKKAGIPAFSKMGTLMIIGVVYTISMGQVVFPYMGQAILFINVYQTLTQSMVNMVQFILFQMPLGFIMTIIYVLVMRYIFRADATPLKNLTEETLGEQKPATSAQKKALICFALMLLFNLAGSMPFLGPLYGFSAQMTFFGGDLLCILAMFFLKRDDGTPLFQLQTARHGVMWDMVMMCAYITAISGYMSAEETGIATLISGVLYPLTQMSPLVFIIGILVATTLITNFANNMVLTIVVMPFVISFFNAIGASPAGTMYLMFMTCQLAICTPGASVMSAAAFTRTDFVRSTDLMKYGAMVVPILLFFLLLIGIPYSMVVFG